MILVNKTAYETATLRKLLTAVHEHLAKTEGRLPGWGRAWGVKKRTITVLVTYSRNEWVTGCATLNGFNSDLRLPKPKKEHCTARDFIWLAYHEVMHLYGRNHAEFYDIQDPEIEIVLSGIGYTLKSELPVTLSKERTMKLKLSGTSFKAVDLTGIPGIGEIKEVKRGKGFVYVAPEATPEAAAEVVKRLQAKDTAESGLKYEERYACRIDAKKIDKLISQASEVTGAQALEGAPAPTA